MRRISTLFAALLSATLLILGIWLLYEGILASSASETAILISGAAFFALGVMTLVSAIRSLLWHRHMVRNSSPNNEMDGAARENSRG
jgi:hypothetical protein